MEGLLISCSTCILRELDEYLFYFLQNHKDAALWVGNSKKLQGSIFTQGKCEGVYQLDIEKSLDEKLFSYTSSHLGFCKADLHPLSCTLALPSGDNDVELFCTKSHSRLSKISPDQQVGMIMCLKWIDQDNLLMGYENGSIGYWNQTSGKLQIAKLSPEPIMCLDFDVLAGKGIFGSSHSNVCIFNMSLQVLETIEIKNSGTACVRIRADGEITVAGCWDGRIRVFDWNDFQLIAVLPFHNSTIVDIEFSEQRIPIWNCSNVMAVASSDCKISLWDIYN